MPFKLIETRLYCYPRNVFKAKKAAEIAHKKVRACRAKIACVQRNVAALVTCVEKGYSEDFTDAFMHRLDFYRKRGEVDLGRIHFQSSRPIAIRPSLIKPTVSPVKRKVSRIRRPLPRRVRR